MYNLTVAIAHTFFVGEEQWLVHNAKRGECIDPLLRYDGPKPIYQINYQHVPGMGQRRGNPKTPLPEDAKKVYENAVPDDSLNPENWYGINEQGQVYRYSSKNSQYAHFSGIQGVGDGTRNITPYAEVRLAILRKKMFGD